MVHLSTLKLSGAFSYFSSLTNLGRQCMKQDQESHVKLSNQRVLTVYPMNDFT